MNKVFLLFLIVFSFPISVLGNESDCPFDVQENPTTIDKNMSIDEIKEHLLCSAIHFFDSQQKHLFYQFEKNTPAEDESFLIGRWKKSVMVKKNPKPPLEYRDMKHGRGLNNSQIDINECDEQGCTFSITVNPHQSNQYTRVVKMFKSGDLLRSGNPYHIHQDAKEMYGCKYLEFVSETPTLGCYIVKGNQNLPTKYEITFFEKTSISID